jgi:hypothetical protein
MKTTTVGIVTPINKDEMNELLKETKETIATGVCKNGSNITFGLVDLWRVRKTNKTSSSLRRHI